MVPRHARHKHMAMAWALAFGFAAIGAQAADLQPVDSVLARIGKRSSSEARSLSPAGTLMKDITAFRSRTAQLPAQAAATEWLALWDRSLALDTQRATTDYEAYDVATREPVGPRSLLAALPAPEAWPLIRAQATARAAKTPENASALGLKLLAEVLTRDAAAARQSLAAFERRAASGPGEREFRMYAIVNMQALMVKLYGTREEIADGFRAAVDAHAKQSFDNRVEVPDLVGLVGEAKAEALLTDALKKPVLLEVREGVATQALARRLALRDVASLRKPQWSLVDSLGTAALYEALQARFDPRVEAPRRDAPGSEAAAEDEVSDYQRRGADMYYFLDQVLAGQHAKAEQAMVRASGGSDSLHLPRQAMGELARQGRNAEVYAYLTDLLGRRPQLPAWDFYLEQDGVLGRSADAIALLDKVLKRTDLTSHQRAELQEKRLDALLGADQVDTAVAGLRTLLAAAPARDDPRLDERTTAAIRLAGLGRVLKKPEWSRLGIEHATRAVALPSKPQSVWRDSAVRALLVELRREGRGDAAQALVLAELERDGGTPRVKGLEAVIPDAARRSALVELAGLYDAAGRPADVRRLLDEVDTWAARDLAELVAEKDSMGTPLGLMAARALKAAGNTAAATAAARAVIARLPAHDPAYQMLVDLAGESSIAELDAMAARDPFEERPLVWKAVVLNRARQFQAAEDSARRAIAIDPSDGEQGVNDRLRAYAVLADVLDGKGDPKAAQGYRRAVAAIRMSEQADELHRLGLYQRAFAGYRAALAEFSDAYCIQSRLAVQLGKQGFKEEALKHYRRAFELMPDSFGRVESHCFGCESVFEGPSAQAVAEEVFSGLVNASTTRPQAPYMLGYLRKEQGRYDDAAVLFRRAIAMDAMYLSAWRQLNDLGGKTYLDPGERDIARLRLFELDPLQRHVRYELNEVADLATLWRALARSGAERAAAADPVYALAASVRAQQQAVGSLPPEMRTQMEKYVDMQSTMSDPQRNHRATLGLASHKLLVGTLQMMGAAGAGLDE